MKKLEGRERRGRKEERRKGGTEERWRSESQRDEGRKEGWENEQRGRKDEEFDDKLSIS